MPKDARAQFIVALVGFEAEMMIGFNGVVPGVLELIGLQLIHQADAPSFLKLIDQDSGAAFGNSFQREVELIAAIAAAGPEHIAGQALGMDAQQGRLFGNRIPHHERENILGLVLGFETEKPECSKRRGEAGFRDFNNFHKAGSISRGSRPAVSHNNIIGSAAAAIGASRGELKGQVVCDFVVDRIAPAVLSHQLIHVKRMERVREGDDVPCIGKRSLAGPILLDAGGDLLHRLRGCSPPAFIDGVEQFVETDPLPITESNGLDAPL